MCCTTEHGVQEVGACCHEVNVLLLCPGVPVVDSNRREMVQKTFDTVAQGYDNPAIRFFADSVPPLVDYLGLRGDECILDVATGTGNAALEFARHLPRGKVHGIDFSAGMLARAQEKKEASGLDHVTFTEMDMQALQFPDGFFDLVVCCFGVFFVEDLVEQLRHMAHKAAPGGRVAITSFSEGLFAPQAELFLNRIEAYGVEVPSTTWKATDTPEKCRALFRAAELSDIAVFRKDLGYYLQPADLWWEILWNAGYRGLIEQLPEDRKQVFKAEHLQEVNAVADASGLWLDIEVLYTIGTKAG